ncbi:MAG: putative sulfate exporter family transporter, partial [Bacteroidia bacterium]|nr:putative sulfate exporter family transporter [Bacteroidia bacterium]
SILMALLAGMLVGNLIKVPENFQSGISFTSGKLLELSILFLAFSINYTHIAQTGALSFSIIAIMIVAMLLFTYYLSIKVKCPGSTGWLVGFGTAICGSSAIAALSPSVTKNKEDIGIAMAVVNLFGSIGMIVMPIVLVKMDLSTTQMGLLLGGTLHSVGNVAGSGYTISNEVGEAAITIKLARVALLSPALIFFNYLVNKDNVKNWKEHFRLPWYLWSFIGITILTSFIHLPDAFLGTMDTAGKIILTIAMAAIGLKVSFKKLYESGKNGILFGLIVFVVEVLLVGGLMMFV